VPVVRLFVPVMVLWLVTNNRLGGLWMLLLTTLLILDDLLLFIPSSYSPLENLVIMDISYFGFLYVFYTMGIVANWSLPSILVLIVIHFIIHIIFFIKRDSEIQKAKNLLVI
jgi:hypothetical protein